MLTYEEIIEDLERERHSVLQRARAGKLGTDIARGALHSLDRLIDKYEEELENG